MKARDMRGLKNQGRIFKLKEAWPGRPSACGSLPYAHNAHTWLAPGGDPALEEEGPGSLQTKHKARLFRYWGFGRARCGEEACLIHKRRRNAAHARLRLVAVALSEHVKVGGRRKKVLGGWRGPGCVIGTAGRSSYREMPAELGERSADQARGHPPHRRSSSCVAGPLAAPPDNGPQKQANPVPSPSTPDNAREKNPYREIITSCICPSHPSFSASSHHAIPIILSPPKIPSLDNHCFTTIPYIQFL